MQTFIDFLVNNYLWFIIIALILIFALIGYLVDTSERANKNNILKEDSVGPIQQNTEAIDNLNMNMETDEIEELEKDVIVMPHPIEETLKTMEEQVQKVAENTEVLDIE